MTKQGGVNSVSVQEEREEHCMKVTCTETVEPRLFKLIFSLMRVGSRKLYLKRSVSCVP